MAISVASVFRNEVDNIPSFAEHLCTLYPQVNEWVVVVQNSTDDTIKLIRDSIYPIVKSGIRVILHETEEWGYCELHRQMSINLCNNPWVFVLDADEYILPDGEWDILVQECKDYRAISIPRVNLVQDVPDKHMMTYFGPDSQVRLVRSDSVEWSRQPHARPFIKGNMFSAQEECHRIYHKWKWTTQYSKRDQILSRMKEYGASESDLNWMKSFYDSAFAGIKGNLGIKDE